MNILKWLFPARCLCCRALSRNSDDVCEDCLNALPRRNPPYIKQQDMSWCVAPFALNDTSRKLLHNLKFHGQLAVADYFAKEIVDCLPVFGNIDLVTWVPLSLQRHRERGYSQSHRMAKGVAKSLGLPCVKLLHKARHTEKQSMAKDVAERQRNVQGVYRVVGDGMIGKRVLLIDDVWTSGATMRECCGVLRAAGTVEVCGAVAIGV